MALMFHTRTVGHGTLGPDEIVELVRAARVSAVADVVAIRVAVDIPTVAREVRIEHVFHAALS
ncbi:MAG TPA: hypothetical protein VM121_08420 [Acidimicrobiales bacterium]|nr:hypothetical protein [Acidimicrobiales bacterium]